METLRHGDKEKIALANCDELLASHILWVAPEILDAKFPLRCNVTLGKNPWDCALKKYYPSTVCTEKQQIR